MITGAPDGEVILMDQVSAALPVAIVSGECGSPESAHQGGPRNDARELVDLQTWGQTISTETERFIGAGHRIIEGRAHLGVGRR